MSWPLLQESPDRNLDEKIEDHRSSSVQNQKRPTDNESAADKTTVLLKSGGGPEEDSPCCD